MRVIVTETFAQSCEIAAGMIAEVVKEKKDARLGLATGGTAEAVYPYLVRDYKNGTLDFSGIDTINLDEYVGLAPDHPQSYRYFMDSNLFNHVNLNKANTYVAKGLGDVDENIREFRYELQKKPIDIQLLGIGVDGHVGFNEPGDVLYDGAHMEVLDESTIEANARYFENRDEVPRKAVSMGMGDIMRAKKLLLLATGASKKEAMAQLLMNEKLDPHFPATMIKMHPDATVFLDKALADLIGYAY